MSQSKAILMKTQSAWLGMLLVCLALAACAASGPPGAPSGPDEAGSAAAAMRAVLDADTALGSVRNHAPESMPVAEAVRAYVAALDAIDFAGCPADFTAAFRRHRDAWRDSIRYLKEHDEMRGEMHDLFDEIRRVSEDARTQIESIEKAIWDTWAEVEAAVER